MHRSSMRRIMSLVFLTGVLTLLAVAVAAQGQAAHTGSHELVAPPIFAKMLPAIDGWTRTAAGTSQIDINAECSYTFAAAQYTKGDVRVKLTLADTGAHPDSLMTLASLIMTLPDTHNDVVPPATSIRRLTIADHTASEIWNGEKQKGEIAVLVAKRFVVSAEALKSDGLEPLREILGAVDLKAIAALASR
jgi:hypothetical protein